MNNRRSAIKIMLKLVRLVAPMLHFMIFAVILGVLGFLCAIFIPVLGTVGVLSIIEPNINISLKVIFTSLIVFGLMRGILRYGEQACNHYIAFRILAIIRDKVFSALRRLAPAKLEGRDKGNLISLITSDIELLEVFYAHTISPITIAAVVSIFMTIFIFSLSTVGGFIALSAYITVGAVIPVINSRLVSGGGMEYRTASGNLNSLFLDSLRGLYELIQFGKTQQKLSETNSMTDRLGKIHKQLKKHEISSVNLTDIAIFAFNLTMIISHIFIVRNGSVNGCCAAAATVALLSSYGPVIALSNLSNTLSQTLASGERVLSLLEEAPQTSDITNGTDTDFDNVSCKNVSFSYGKEKILENVSLSAKSNKITGIYGKSGCGKSTLLKLIMRFWNKDSGDILLSDVEINKINTAALRKNESYCTQETHLFNDTVKNNIKIANYNANDEEIIQAAKSASIHDFIESLPDKYDTRIGELGDRLSGGEKQRIGLARAFLSGASLMLLDEPTSNLDSLNEAVILKSLYNTADKTIILISHRKSTLGIADEVYSLESNRKS